ncbi:MraY family glycosyltransferase [Lactococcus protaetiae]|uniref:Undecaprenyl/decaprenyl-phosphate alpha-N-acetylglucosaminyl 1-phosphate transferase n=1 Tax=Lactococcus protaetiae TaxID=2592653 RepID=A0A514ZAY9_9LACT|nr:MraY family glycosyltransferase [Lactococcus protaetiae]MCL2112830.1 undecaprenyl/decaprenyl-phosphate alpha-N-acetylglucosaminyl 1-phosphate transferase [Streptococcaceae bacterium]QDK71754.1 undecaprenyl/decaprenyl-phosphate alpha-N-acetylglucosaminyl 1-phosphate transferase [Lactococcus protaetiae]
MVDTLKEIPFALKFLITVMMTFGISVILTPIMTFVSRMIGAVDKPNERRINKKPMPSAGGLAIFIAFAVATLLILPHIVHSQPPYVGNVQPLTPNAGPPRLESYFDYIWPFVVAGGIVVLTGLIDDIKEISPKMKLLGLIIAASFIWFFTHARFDNIKIPFGGPFLSFPAWLSYIFTVFWILAITNAINLIDGLDGLASGVSVISLTTMGIVSYFFLPSPNVFLPITIFTIVAAIMGFFPYNYHPAIIYLGDTGALFLGFMISVASLQGLKNATAVAVLTPLLILGVPLTDTIVAMIRRKLNRQSIATADKRHLHHRLMALGFTHRGAVLVIYAIAAIFAFISLILQVSSRIGGIFLVVACLFGLEIFIELVGILGENRQPVLKTMKFIGNSSYREEVLHSKTKDEDNEILEDEESTQEFPMRRLSRKDKK